MSRRLTGIASAVTLGTVPYVALKAVWLAGGDWGLLDPALMRTSTYIVANSVTLALDLVVVCVAWLLARSTRRWLLLVLAPMVWCATGLMATPALSAALVAVTGSTPTRLAGDAVEPWVYSVVYLGFGVQGVGLAALYLIRTTRTWPWLLAPRSQPIGPVLVAGAVGGIVTGIAHALLAVGADSTWWEPAVTANVEHWPWVATGLLCLAAALGAVGAVRRSGVVAGLCAWVGTGAMVCWSGYTLLVAAVDEHVAETTPTLLTVVTALTGMVLVIALTMSLRKVSPRRGADGLLLGTRRRVTRSA